MDFSKWLNNKFIPNNPEYCWIKEISSKSIKQNIINAKKAFKRFFKHQSEFPKFKKKNNSDVKMYFVKTDAKSIIQCERYRIKIPTLGWARIKETLIFQLQNPESLLKVAVFLIKQGEIIYRFS